MLTLYDYSNDVDVGARGISDSYTIYLSTLSVLLNLLWTILCCFMYDGRDRHITVVCMPYQLRSCGQPAWYGPYIIVYTFLSSATNDAPVSR